MNNIVGSTLRQQLVAILGEKGIREADDPDLPHTILRPESTAQVSAILKLCNDHGQALVPIGGRTGLVDALQGGAGELGIALERMHAVEEVDEINRTLTAQAGCILQVAVEAAAEKNLLLPLDLGARGSATLGGNVATNAGGNRVIRYGMMRDMVLGLEVVLADGTIVSNLNKMTKNNTGYDLKQWFIGAEGTLGVITRVVIRLTALPTSQNTALLAIPDFASAQKLLTYLHASLSGTLSAFECMWPGFYEHVTAQGHRHQAPLPHGYPYYILVETLGAEAQSDLDTFESVLAAALEQGLIVDAVVAKSQRERMRLWDIRDDVLDFEELGPQTNFDISLTLDQTESFIQHVDQYMATIAAPINVVFGHLGDGNLHLILGSKDADAYDGNAIENAVYKLVEQHQGSISAEHGIGLLKRQHLRCSRSPQELQLMYAIKRTLDPNNILNPGKIFPADKVGQK